MSESGRPVPSPIRRFPVRVYLEDTDALGIVYYANFLRFAERARTELLRDLGVDHSAMIAADGLNFAVTRCEIDYLSPARLDDRLEVETSLLGIGGATLELLQRVRRGGDEIARVTVRLACTNRAGRPRRLPAGLRKILEGLEQPQERVG